MARARAAAGSLVFFVVAPCVVVGLVPWWLAGGELREPVAHWWPARVLGGLLVAAGAAVLVLSFVRFVVEGVGTPAPVAPTRHLVVGGFYRYVRNPIYLALAAILVGETLLLGRPWLLVYAVAVVGATAAFVRLYEEPALSEQFGTEYEAYRQAVPGWWPRRSPWRPDG